MDGSKLWRKQMIEYERTIKLTLTEFQAQELYEFLDRKKTAGFDEQTVSFIYKELKKLFGNKGDFNYETYVEDYK
jgi:hypothetical protein